MDTLRSILFYAFAAVTVAGALVAALGPSRRLRALGVGVVGAGLALLYADLEAGFAGLATLVAYLGMAALLLARGIPDRAREAAAARSHQVGAAAAALLFAALGYAAYRGGFHVPGYPGGEFGAAAVGRALIGRDALAAEAVAGLLTAGLVTLASARLRRR